MQCRKRSAGRLIPKNLHGQSGVRQRVWLAVAHAGRAATKARVARGDSESVERKGKVESEPCSDAPCRSVFRAPAKCARATATTWTRPAMRCKWSRKVRITSCHFLSRPRRFGKSLFLDTIKELFEGGRELIRGTLCILGNLGAVTRPRGTGEEPRAPSAGVERPRKIFRTAHRQPGMLESLGDRPARLLSAHLTVGSVSAMNSSGEKSARFPDAFAVSDSMPDGRIASGSLERI